jgi:DNA-binding phage protein
MNANTLRDLIRDQIAHHALPLAHVARLAGVKRTALTDYLDGRADTTTAKMLAVAAAVGIAVTAAPVKRFEPTPPPTGGRPKKDVGIPST